MEGGELFDRIIDENYNLTELDTVLFIRQICEGLQYMHKMYILHLDLKVNLLQFYCRTHLFPMSKNIVEIHTFCVFPNIMQDRKSVV